VCRVPKTGGAVEILAADQPGPWALVLDERAVYWTNSYDGTVMKVAK
jgi:hypothetical protein